MKRVALPAHELHAAIVARVSKMHVRAMARLVADELVEQMRRGEVDSIEIDGTSFVLAPSIGAERIVGRVS